MKNRFWVMTIIALITLSGVVRGAEDFRFFLGEESLREYHATNGVKSVSLRIVQNNETKGKISLNLSVSNYNELQNNLRLLAANVARYGAETVPPVLDRDVSFQILTRVLSWPKGYVDMVSDFEYMSHEFLLLKNGTNYIVPSVITDSYALDWNFADPVVGYFPSGILWARAEVSDSLGELIDVFDTFLDPSNEGFITVNWDVFLNMRKNYAISGKSGPFRVKTFVQSNDGYYTFDEGGMEIVGNPLKMTIVKASDGAMITVSGDPNRIFNLEASSDLKSWEVLTTAFVPPYNSWHWPVATIAPGRFFRVIPIKLSAVNLQMIRNGYISQYMQQH